MDLEELKTRYPNIGKRWTNEDYGILRDSINNNYDIQKVSTLLGRKEISIIIKALQKYHYFFDDSKNMIINVLKDDFIISLIYELTDALPPSGNKKPWTQQNIDGLIKSLSLKDSLFSMSQKLDKAQTTVAVKVYRSEKILLPEIKKILLQRYKDFDFILKFVSTFDDEFKLKKNSISMNPIYYNWSKEEDNKLKILYEEKLLSIEEISEILNRPRVRIISRIKFLSLENKSQYKDDSEEIRTLLKHNDVDVIYHFTDIRNLVSIKQYGLLALDYLRSKKIKFYNGSSDFGIYDKYISLSLTTNHPMMWQAYYEKRITNPQILEIDPAVMLLKDTFYTNGISNRRGVPTGRDVEFLVNNIDLDINPSSDVDKRKVEILAYEKIEKKYILNL